MMGIRTTKVLHGLVLVMLTLTWRESKAFCPVSTTCKQNFKSQLYLSAPTNEQDAVLSVTLEKPLGLILEEVEEGAASGVKVEELADSGSAYSSQYKNQLVGLKVATVMGQDVLSITFDEVMDKIIEAPSPVTIEFLLESSEQVVEEKASALEVGTAVTLTVKQEGKPDMDVNAKVGDNLRLTLLANDVELYRGLKKKLGNCGGGGQCTFCSVEVTDDDGWSERSDYETEKIGKKLGPNVRMACLNNIEGPATVQTL